MPPVGPLLVLSVAHILCVFPLVRDPLELDTCSLCVLGPASLFGALIAFRAIDLRVSPFGETGGWHALCRQCTLELLSQDAPGVTLSNFGALDATQEDTHLNFCVRALLGACEH